MHETALDRFLRIKNYEDAEEVIAWLNNEADILNNDIPKLYGDMLALSMLSDIYYSNVPEDIQDEIINRCNGDEPVLISMFNIYRVAENRMVAMANWSDTVQDIPEADRVRRYIYSLIEEYHEKGWEVHVSSVEMEEGEPDKCGTLSAGGNKEDVDEFEADILSILGQIFNDFGEELSFQLFFNRPGYPAEKAFILVNCLWSDEGDGYEDCEVGPFIISGKGKGSIELLAPDNLGLQVLSEGLGKI